MERTILVTGSDKTYFLMGCMLVHSLQKHAPRLPVYYLDFGLDRAQRKFLNSICTVVRRPRHLDPAMHFFASKAAMGEYLRDTAWTSVVWLDGDMIALNPIGDSLKGVLRRMDEGGNEVAACVDSSGTIGEFIVQKQAVAPFVAALAAAGVAQSEPYLNSGFVVFRAQAFLDEWHRLASTVPQHLLFEQNAFNLAVRTRAAPLILDAGEWNVHGGRLLTEKAAGAGSSLILHATSERTDADLACNDWVQFGPQRISSMLRLFRSPALRAYQEAVLMDFMKGAHHELQRLGILA